MKEKKNSWPPETVHPIYGKVQMMGILSGEPYRWLLKNGVVSMIPLSILQEMENEE